MSKYIHKSHNVSVLLYHYVCPAKYRRVIFDDKVDKVLVQTCKEISKRYEINIIEIGTDGDHVHFLIQSVPMLSPTQIAAFGDGDNDADMLEYAGCGIAVANASPACMAAADQTTLDYRKDGVAHGIYHILHI